MEAVSANELGVHVCSLECMIKSKDNCKERHWCKMSNAQNSENFRKNILSLANDFCLQFPITGGAYKDGPEIWVARPLFFFFFCFCLARPIRAVQNFLARPLLQKNVFWPVLISAPFIDKLRYFTHLTFYTIATKTAWLIQKLQGIPSNRCPIRRKWKNLLFPIRRKTQNMGFVAE